MTYGRDYPKKESRIIPVSNRKELRGETLYQMRCGDVEYMGTWSAGKDGFDITHMCIDGVNWDPVSDLLAKFDDVSKIRYEITDNL